MQTEHAHRAAARHADTNQYNVASRSNDRKVLVLPGPCSPGRLWDLPRRAGAAARPATSPIFDHKHLVRTVPSALECESGWATNSSIVLGNTERGVLSYIHVVNPASSCLTLHLRQLRCASRPSLSRRAPRRFDDSCLSQLRRRRGVAKLP